MLNYNYARYLPERLESIFAQSYPVLEILLLDDASTDDSLAVARAAAAQAGRELRYILSEKNSGSVFAQWRRAAMAARGEYIWLCEADDSAAPEFLSHLLDSMGAEQPLLAFTDSRAVNADGAQVMPSYQSYYFASGVKTLAASKTWASDEFARQILTVRNLIPNVSAVLWRRDALLAALQSVPDLESWRLAGDWRLYLALLCGQPGTVTYIAEPLNTHRRHAGGVTARLDAAAHVAEIARMHAIAAQAFALPPTVRAVQAEYVASITTQLGAEPPPPVARRRKV